MPSCASGTGYAALSIRLEPPGASLGELTALAAIHAPTPDDRLPGLTACMPSSLETLKAFERVDVGEILRACGGSLVLQ
jgi:hypothetical protein